MTTNDFLEKWSDLKNQKGYMQRVDPNHPLDFFVGINEKGYDQLVLITVVEPAQMRSSKALDVEKIKEKMEGGLHKFPLLIVITKMFLQDYVWIW